MYALVVTRNVFDLNPPAPVVTTPGPPADPPPKITPNGVFSIFGHTQVLFKAAVARPGQPAKEESYNLSEGQSEDDIEVVRIDEKNGIVTFNNHGTEQELPLIAGQASGGAAPDSAAPVNLPNMTGRVPLPGAIGSMPNGGNGAFGARNPNLGNGGNFPAANFGGNTYGANAGQSPQVQETLSPEAQMILIAAQHAKAQQEGNPMAPIFPPTPIDADAGVVAPDNGPPSPPSP
jgi:hypothetical protein